MTSPLPSQITLLGRTYDLLQLLRLVTIVGAYILLRPYLLKLSERFQSRDHERPLDVAGGEHDSPAAVSSGATRKLRGVGDGEEEDGDSDGADMSWGAKARRRKRAELRARRELMEREEAQRAEEEEDRDIEDLLE